MEVYRVALEDHLARRFEVVIFPGMPVRELTGMLERASGRSGVVGLVDPRDDAVFGLTTVCEAPDLLDYEHYRILFKPGPVVSRSTSPVRSLVHSSSNASFDIHSHLASQGHNDEDTDTEEEEEEDTDTETEDEDDDDQLLAGDESHHEAALEARDEEDEQEFWLKQAHLLMAITHMEDQGDLGEADADIVRNLVSEGDERVLAAMDVYTQDRDWEDLADTLQHIAHIEAPDYADEDSGDLDDDLDSDDDDDDDDDLDSDDDDDEGEDDEEGDDEEANDFAPGDVETLHDEEMDEEDQQLLYQVIVALHKRGLLSPSETLTVKRLVDLRNPLVQAASQVYEDRGDEEDFSDTLRRIARFYGLERVLLMMLQHGYLTQAEAKVLMRMFRETHSAVSLAWKVYCEHQNERVLADQLLTILIDLDKGAFLSKMLRQGVFDSVEVRILVELLKREDPSFLAIFDVLLEDGDLEDAIDSLHRLCIARSATRARPQQMDSTLGNAATETMQFVRSLHREGVFSALQFQVLSSLISKQDERILAAHETHAATMDLDDFIDTLKQISVVAGPEAVRDWAAANRGGADATLTSIESDKIILDTMFYLVAQGELDPEEAAVLGPLVMRGDPRLLAAFDVFRIEKDTDDLVDSLSRLAIRELRATSVDEYEEIVKLHRGVAGFEDDEEEEDDDDDDDDGDDEEEEDDEDEEEEEEEREKGNDERVLHGAARAPNGLSTPNKSIDKGDAETITDDEYDWLSEGDANAESIKEANDQLFAIHTKRRDEASASPSTFHEEEELTQDELD
ncbi:Hypothetical Protein FCC1311_012972 [Hondaea fermentalgiana]|uniref:Uncharacterized protein n=1 Tax=Hondaea fermentalgiana TaxID=2315210 RepID=A0A2R5G249_9STRA|nr:Hypothetical Protein FCC1311_012972 [Hondaea fermentalgiana]|eukprot:GBG25080.1 Hypothetical Protein FCC1311_012972 [Hondaea fermentalgiana]